jgi:hypothetical protein
LSLWSGSAIKFKASWASRATTTSKNNSSAPLIRDLATPWAARSKVRLCQRAETSGCSVGSSDSINRGDCLCLAFVSDRVLQVPYRKLSERIVRRVTLDKWPTRAGSLATFRRNILMCGMPWFRNIREKIEKKEQKWMAHEGIEPATFALLARRSNQLS